MCNDIHTFLPQVLFALSTASAFLYIDTTIFKGNRGLVFCFFFFSVFLYFNHLRVGRELKNAACRAALIDQLILF